MERSFLNLPDSTFINKPLPKTQFFKHFGTNTKEQSKFDEDISRIYIENLISENTIALSSGNNIKMFYVLKVLLKHKEYSEKSITTIAKNIPQNIIFALCSENTVQLSVLYNNIYYKTQWKEDSETELKIEGLNVEAVWNNCISKIAKLDDEISDTEELKLSLETKSKIEALEKQIEKLDKKARKEVQPRQKFDLVQQIKNIKKEIENLKEEGN